VTCRTHIEHTMPVAPEGVGYAVRAVRSTMFLADTRNAI
jgi:hypothetical protein